MSDQPIIPPWEEARERLRSTRKPHYAQSEADLGGAQQINSGRHWHSKRDVKKFDFLFENRQTDGKTITVNALELVKIAREAIFERSLPAMRLDFSKHYQDWVLIRRADFEDLVDDVAQLEAAVAGLTTEISRLEAKK